MKNLTWVIGLGLCLGVSQMGSYVVAADLEGNEESLYSGNMLDPNKWIRRMEQWKAERDRKPVDQMLNNALADLEWPDYGRIDTPKQKKLLQFPGDGDYQSFGWGHD
jgi:hypothetical protein